MAKLQQSMAAVVEWPVNEEDYKLCKIIGKGADGIVYESLCMTNSERCAIKCTDIQEQRVKQLHAMREVEILRRCNHENVIKYHTSFQIKREMWLITRLYQEGSLSNIIKNKIAKKNITDGLFNEETIVTVLRNVLKGLEYLHKGIIHRDIKAENILVGEDGSIQIADFGLSRSIGTNKYLHWLLISDNKAGTPLWYAPEIIRNCFGYDFKVDIWSLGILAILTVAGILRYQEFDSPKLYKLILETDAPTIDTVSGKSYTKYGKSIRDMIANCLQKDPKKRSTAKKLLKHPFFEKPKDNDFLIEHLLNY